MGNCTVLDVRDRITTGLEDPQISRIIDRADEEIALFNGYDSATASQKNSASSKVAAAIIHERGEGTYGENSSIRQMMELAQHLRDSAMRDLKRVTNRWHSVDPLED